MNKKTRRLTNAVSSFQKFSSYIWSSPYSAETWIRVSLPYHKIDQVLKKQKKMKLPTTLTAVITVLVGRVMCQYPELKRYIQSKQIKQCDENSIFFKNRSIVY